MIGNLVMCFDVFCNPTNIIMIFIRTNWSQIVELGISVAIVIYGYDFDLEQHTHGHHNKRDFQQKWIDLIHLISPSIQRSQILLRWAMGLAKWLVTGVLAPYIPMT